MTKNLNSYIDHCIIDEYAFKSFRFGFSLDASEIPQHDFDNFLDYLVKHDPATREIIEERMQVLINGRLSIMECESRYDKGYIPLTDQINGETLWVEKRGYCHE